MKLTMKLFLIISLFCSAAFAEGDQNTGNKNGGGFVCSECVVVDDGKENADSEKTEVENSFVIFIRDFFSKMLN